MDLTKKLQELYGEVLIPSVEDRVYLALFSEFYNNDKLLYKVKLTKQDLEKGIEKFRSLVEDFPEKLRLVEFID